MQKQKIKILYIDDEMPALFGFKAAFRYMYDIYIAQTGFEAYDILTENPNINIILSDQRMPGTTGIELFEEFIVDFPLPVRMILTAYTDVKTIIDSINRGQIFRYIKKPWDEDEIVMAIEEAYKYYVTVSLLSKKNEEIKIAYRELDKFSYSVVHDLHGPISSIRGGIELLRNENDIKEIKNMLFLISDSTQKLDEFIANIHDHYRINRGDLIIEKIDFPKLVDDLKSVYTITSIMQHIKFTINLDEQHQFLTDLMSLRLILNNLLSNAFKYQKRKKNADKWVELNIVVDKEKAVITVKDNGIGINSNYISQIYDMFFRATSDEYGSGFGLFNVKQILEKIGGEIKVKSKLNVGTEFEVTIPSKK